LGSVPKSAPRFGSASRQRGVSLSPTKGTVMKRLALVIAMLLTGSAAYAQDGITLGPPGYGGTGCPGGSVSVTLSPDNTSLSLLFDRYVVEAGGSTGRSFDRKSCNLAIPVHVPQGLSVSIISID